MVSFMANPESTNNSPEELTQKLRSLVTDLLGNAPQDYVIENEHMPGFHSLELYLRADSGQLYRVIRATRVDINNPDANDSIDILRPKAVRYYEPYTTHSIQEEMDENEQPHLYVWESLDSGEKERTLLTQEFLDDLDGKIRLSHATYPAPFEYREGWTE
jgi:hypothetical protein